MKKIIYYVASSIDGFIAGKDDDISRFILQGKGVEKYQADLAQFETVIMGRRTYEIGFRFGLAPGQPAYPNMEHYIFSDSMKIDNLASSVHIEAKSLDRDQELKSNSNTDIYLCGGGDFAGWLLDNGLIDQLKMKLNPITLGEGTRLFGQSKITVRWEIKDREAFDDGLQILTYDRIG